ncbi:MAG: peptide chain release factor family protein, partial [Planctomycetota bacterium]
MHPARLPVEELLREVRVERTRASGPGGQHRNRVATAIRLTHLPTGVQAQASERRSQNENRLQAIQRLRLRLALEVREPLSGERFVAPGA